MSLTMDSSTQTSDEADFGPGAVCFPSPRVQIDTSAPFRSVEEAVIRFGGRGYWIPRDLFQSAPPGSDEEVDIRKLEQQAAEMLKDLDTKQQETLGILKELQLTKTLIEELKQNLKKELNPANHAANAEQTEPIYDSPNLFPLSPAGLVMLELKQAKQHLSRSTTDLESIRASVQHVNQKMEKKKEAPIRNPIGISRELRELNNEAEQFMKSAEAAKSEVLKAMAEVEQTKSGLKVIEMRWIAAKKLEEAAKATEELALAEISAMSGNEAAQQKPSRISLSMEEYCALAERARKGEPIEGSCRGSKTSIGDILSRKLVMRDDLDIGRQGEERVSLNQMLDRHRSGTPPPPRRRSEKRNDGDSKGFFWKRKGFGFVHVSVPVSKQGKSKIQSLNLW